MKTEFRTKYTYRDVASASEVVRELKNYPVQNVCIVFDSNITNSTIHDLLSRLNSDFSVTAQLAHDGKEPTTTLVDSLREEMKKIEINTIIGIGGGSTLDLMKSLSVLHFQTQPSSMAQGVRLDLERKLFSIAIPTTAGSGSEATKSAVLTNPQARIKRGINHPLVLPEIAFLVSPLLESIPDHVLVASIFDGFTHALESFIGLSGNETTQASGRNAIDIYMAQFELLRVAETLRIHPEILHASNLAGFAICNSETGPVHAMSYPLSEYYGYGHGQAIGLLLAKTIELYATLDKNLESKIEAVTGVRINSLCEMLIDIYDKFVRPTLPPASFEEVEKLATRSLELAGAINNCPVSWSREMSLTVFRQVVQ